MNRRGALKLMAGAAAAGLVSNVVRGADASAGERSQLGLVVYCCGLRRTAMKTAQPPIDLFEPARFLEHCRQVGAGGMQCSLAGLDDAAAKELRRQAEAAGMYLEATAGPPKNGADVERFEQEVKIAALAGALAIRTVIMPGRRYERFDSLDEFNEFAREGVRSLERAAGVVEKYRVPLAVENHKDFRSDQRVDQLETISSEFVGACLDTGNSVALLEDPVETATKLAPWAKSVHLKDQALAPYGDGFLLADIPLGQGCLPLKEIVEIIRREKPGIRFSLELITRDPLKVPVLTDKYWATFPDMPASELARTLRMAHRHANQNLQYPSGLSPERQVDLEDENVRASLTYARAELGI